MEAVRPRPLLGPREPTGAGRHPQDLLGCAVQDLGCARGRPHAAPSPNNQHHVDRNASHATTGIPHRQSQAQRPARFRTPKLGLVTTCTQCGSENPDGARFCNSCGAPLTAAAEPARDVRKTVTVLFCDVVGSTALGEQHDPEVVRGVMARFYAAVREPVERHGGRVEKMIGDALVAVFGMPVVHEDDALRAVRAALEMQAAMSAMDDIEARIGVNTGDVLARDATPGESLVVGDAVNVAARLEQAAAPGEVLVGEATWALVGHAARGDRAAPIAAKGKREPLVAWRLRGVDPAASGHRRRLDLPMVGREAELDALRWALARAEQTRRPHLVTVLGQPGIGKSRLVSEMPRLRDDLTVLVGHCRAMLSPSALEPLLEVAAATAPAGRALPEAIPELMPGEPDAPAVAACLTPAGAASGPGRCVGHHTADRDDGSGPDGCDRPRGRPLGRRSAARYRRAAARSQPARVAGRDLHRQAGVCRAEAGMGRGGKHDLGLPRAARRCANSRPPDPRQPRACGRPGRARDRGGRGQPPLCRASGRAVRRP